MRSLIALLAIATLASAPPAVAQDQVSYPPRRTGQWELRFSPENNPALFETMQQCVDAESDQLLHVFGGLMNAGTTCKSSQRKDGANLQVDNSCTTGTATRHVRAVFNGDFNANYTIQITERTEGDAVADQTGPRTTRVTARWVGACKADQRPGDVVLPGGKTMNVNDFMKALKELDVLLKKKK